MAKKRFDKGAALAIEQAASAAVGTVVVFPTGVVAQKHGNGLDNEGEWFLAQDWESPISDKEVATGGAKYLATVPMANRRFN